MDFADGARRGGGHGTDSRLVEAEPLSDLGKEQSVRESGGGLGGCGARGITAAVGTTDGGNGGAGGYGASEGGACFGGGSVVGVGKPKDVNLALRRARREEVPRRRATTSL